MYNRVILVGRLTADPDLRYTPSGTPVASFRLAVDRGRPRGEGGERQTDFINIVAWQQQAEFATNYLTKGRLVLVEGRLQVRQWTTPEGQRRYATDVVCSRVQALERRREEAGPAPAEEAAAPPTEGGVEDVSEGGGPWDDQ
jgi:single-strand DNA-binding protein